MNDPAIVPLSGGFYYDSDHDTNDNKPWSETDIADLKASIAHGSTLAETASFLCRSGTLFDVAAKAKELGLAFSERA
jgi:hypothetical protein